METSKYIIDVMGILFIKIISLMKTKNTNYYIMTRLFILS